MSTCLGIVTLSDSNIGRLLKNPTLVWRVIAPDNPEPYLQAVKESGGGGLVRKLMGAVNSVRAKSPPTLDYVEEEGAVEDLDKSWHGIHYLMTGKVWTSGTSLDFLISGGTEVGDVDLGSGPGRVFRSSEVRRIAKALAKVDDDRLRERFDAEEMMSQRIYPEIWLSGAGGKDALEYCLEYFGVMKALVQYAAHENMGMLVHMS